MPFTSRLKQPKKPQKPASHEQFATAALNYLTADAAELARFMSATGYDPDQLRLAIGSNDLDMALMDYFAANEPALLAMCANMNLDVQRFMAAWHRLNRSM